MLQRADTPYKSLYTVNMERRLIIHVYKIISTYL